MKPSQLKPSILPLLVFILLIFFCTTEVLASPEPILTVDTGGHKGIIKDLLVTSDNRYLISASTDKTIRVWDIETKKEVRKILGQIGPGLEGQIFAMALSPDDHWLAVGGYLSDDKTKRWGDIRIYDFASGKLKQLLQSHISSVDDLAFSPDGSLLLSGSADTTVKVWSVPDFSLQRTLEGHTNYVCKVAALADNSIVSTGDDEQIILWKDGSIKNSYRHSHDLNHLAVSRDWIAASGPQNDKKILLFNHRLELQKTLDSPTKPTGLSFSKDGSLLLVGTGSTPRICIIYDAHNGFQEKSRFSGHDNLVQATTFLAQNTAVTGGGDNKDIYIWKDGLEQGHLVGAGSSIWAVGLDQDALHWGKRYKTSPHNNSNPLGHRFDLQDFSLGKSSGVPQRIDTSYRNWSLSHRSGGDYGKSDASLVIKKDDKEQARITREATEGYRHRTYGFTGDGTIISGGSNGYLIAYDRKGQELGRFIGHTGEVWSIAVLGNRLLSGSSDQTIKLWDLDELKKGTKKISPILNLFAGKDGEWVAWSKSGYYASSANGDKYVGFHINGGPDKEAQFYPAARFQASLYRPDVVKALISSGSEEEALKIVGRIRRTEKIDTASILPPLIELQRPATSTQEIEGDTLQLQCLIKPQSKHPITEIQLFVNGRPTAETRDIKRRKTNGGITIHRSLTMPLQSNVVTIVARTAHSSSNPLVLEINKRDQKSSNQNIFKPSLYLFGVGVSKYQDRSMNLRFAADDARGIEELFKKQAGSLYKEVQTKIITDGEATRDNILDGLDWLKDEATQRDVAVIFIAGHGINEEQNYYFLNHDANPEKLRRTAVNWRDFKDIVNGLPSKVILLADTCHSGAILGDGRRGDNSITSAIKDLIAAGSGQVIMTAATGSSYSLERPEWGHGAFTKALLEGFGANNTTLQADYNNNGVVTVKEIDLFVTSRVKELTNGKQKPTTIIPDSVPDFAVTAR